MSKKTPSVIDYFSLNGDVVEEANLGPKHVHPDFRA